MAPGRLNTFLANVIAVLHVLFIVWFTIAPFTNSPPMLVLHFITYPFLLLHWATNVDSCCLTLVEQKLRGVESDRSFFHNLVSPIYLLSAVPDKDLRQGVTLAAGLLWLVTVNKMLTRPQYWREAFNPGSSPKAGVLPGALAGVHDQHDDQAHARAEGGAA